MKKVLLTGAAGNIGLETLKQLVNAKYDVTVLELLNKKSKRRLHPYKNKIKIIYGSINDYNLVVKSVKNQDVIIHLAAIIPPLADKNPELTRKVNYFGTLNIIKAIEKENPKCFLLYSSSVSIYGDRISNPWIKVGDPLLPSEGDYYALTKIETEDIIKKANINYSIFRLTGIMGHPATDPLMFHMPLDTKMEIASTVDTALAFKNAVEKTKELNGKTFNLGGGKECRTTYREFLAKMFKVYGLNIKYLTDVAFAEKNFHCGYFLDSDKLNNILHFQTDNLTTYYNRVKKETKGIIRFFSKIFSKPIIYFLEKKSEPLQAKKKNNYNLIDRFFNKRP
ncbi:MAG: NAD(P)-dependent oxidoreductase [Bacilli bacterium]